MSQIVTTAYQDLDTSYLHNNRFVGVIKQGVYQGFAIRPNAGNANKLDVYHGNESTSVLVTSEGIRVSETTPVLGAATVPAADPNLTRIDLIVAEYRYVAASAIEQTYKIVKGKNQPNLSTDPVKPSPESQYQVPLAYVTIRPQLAFGGSSTAQVLITDIQLVDKASLVLGPEEIAALKPEIVSGDSRLLYVHPGVMPSADGSTAIQFSGGYSPVIVDATTAENEIKFYLVGVTDGGAVEILGEGSALSDLPSLSIESLPVAIIETQKLLSQIKILNVTDIRFPFARRLANPDEEDVYTELLGNSVFRHLKVERFADADYVDLTSVKLQTTGSADDLVAIIDSKDTSLLMTWSGSSTIPTDAVLVSSKDLLVGSAIGTAKHFMLAVDTPFNGLTFQYSTSSALSGFTTTAFYPNKVVRIPGTGAKKLFLRFIVPAAAFVNNKEAKLFSYGVLFNLDEGAINSISLTELGLSSFSKSLNNLIANGSFYRWSKSLTDGSKPDLTSQGALDFSLSSSANDTLLADGWQATTLDFEVKGNAVRRVIKSSGTANASDTALEFTSSSAGSGTQIVLEYRIPNVSNYINEHLTFAINYETETPGFVSAGIAQFTRGTAGLAVKHKDVLAGNGSVGELLVSTSTSIGPDIDQISFFVTITATGAEATHQFYNARAVLGLFNVVPFTYVNASESILRRYYERGRVYTGVNVIEGLLMGAGIQFGTIKAVELGPVTARTIQTSEADRSTNIDQLVYDADEHGFVVSGSATGSGFGTVDADWEAYVKYEGTVS